MKPKENIIPKFTDNTCAMNMIKYEYTYGHV